MTYEDDYSIPEEILEQICEDGFDAVPELIRIVLNTAVVMEISEDWQTGKRYIKWESDSE